MVPMSTTHTEDSMRWGRPPRRDPLTEAYERGVAVGRYLERERLARDIEALPAMPPPAPGDDHHTDQHALDGGATTGRGAA